MLYILDLCLHTVMAYCACALTDPLLAYIASDDVDENSLHVPGLRLLAGPPPQRNEKSPEVIPPPPPPPRL